MVMFLVLLAAVGSFSLFDKFLFIFLFPPDWLFVTLFLRGTLVMVCSGGPSVFASDNGL